MKPFEQLRLFAECLYEPNDIVEIRMLLRGTQQSQSEWKKADKLHQWIFDLQNRNQTFDLYAGANPRSAIGKKNASGVALARCIFVEWDNLNIAEAAAKIDSHGLPLPTCVVWSGGGVHVYWRLTEPIVDLTIWSALQRQMIRLLDSDKCIHDPPRIMRLPGFFNHKPGRTASWLVYANPSQRVRAVDLAERCPPVEQLPTCHRSSYAMPTERAWLLRRAANYLSRIPPAISGNHGHNQTFRAAAILAKFGLTEEEAMGILHDYNERCDPPWKEGELRRKYQEAVKHKHLTRTPA